MTANGRCDIVVKSWFGDLCWLVYCLRFLERNWREPDSRIIVLINENCRGITQKWAFGPEFEFYYVDPWPDGNQFECYLTLLLDHFSDAQYFAVFDSDTMLEAPMRASDKTEDGRPIIYYQSEEKLLESPVGKMAYKMWFPLMEYWLGVKPEADYMCHFPFIYRASSIQAVRRLITAKTKRGLRDALYSDVRYEPENFGEHPFKFSEHNVIGFYCHLHEPDGYVFKPLEPDTPSAAKIYHSWSEWSEEMAEQLERKLK